MNSSKVSQVLVLIMASLGNGALAQNGIGFESFGIKRLAYETGPGSLFAPHEDIFVVDALKAKPRHLVGGTAAVWSPDGQTMAYCVHVGWGTKHITFGQMYLINADGSGQRQITNFPDGACPMDWSPDGRKISSSQGILILSNDTKSITSVQAAAGGLWSPDGKKLAFSKYRESLQGSGSIWISNADGSDARKVIDDNSEFLRLCWSPDGESILFSSHRDNSRRMEIFRVSLDGSRLEKIATDNKMSFYAPLISPDGKYLVVGAGNGQGDQDPIIAIDLTTQKRTVIAHGRDPHIVWTKN